MKAGYCLAKLHEARTEEDCHMPDRTASKPREKTRKAPSPRRKPREIPGVAKEEGSRTDPAVVAFLRDLEHPLKEEIEAVRQLILDVGPEVREGIKWNAPSFRTTDHFATFNLRAKDRVNLILHMGAKVKATAATGVKVDDPAGLLEWLAKDRCIVTLQDGADVRARGAALQAILREWIRLL